MLPNFRPPDIGLIGRARTGKDTAAAILRRKWGHERLAFADPLRDALAALDPIVYNANDHSFHRYTAVLDAIGYEAAKDRVPEVRRLMQHMGVGMREHLGPDVWVEALMRRVDALQPTRPVVVADVRFPNEAERLRREGFVLVRLTRAAAPSAGSHVSETALDDFAADITFANDGSLDELEAFLDGVVLENPRPA